MVSRSLATYAVDSKGIRDLLSWSAGSRTITGVLSDHQWSRGLARQNAGLRWKSAPGGRPSRTVWIRSGPGRLTTSCQRKRYREVTHTTLRPRSTG
jgi:hypothetical protein